MIFQRRLHELKAIFDDPSYQPFDVATAVTQAHQWDLKQQRDRIEMETMQRLRRMLFPKR